MQNMRAAIENPERITARIIRCLILFLGQLFMPLIEPQSPRLPTKESMLKDENAPSFDTFPWKLLKDKLRCSRAEDLMVAYEVVVGEVNVLQQRHLSHSLTW